MKITDTQADLLAWLYSPGERYVHWKEWQGHKWGATLIDRASLCLGRCGERSPRA